MSLKWNLVSPTFLSSSKIHSWIPSLLSSSRYWNTILQHSSTWSFPSSVSSMEIRKREWDE